MEIDMNLGNITTTMVIDMKGIIIKMKGVDLVSTIGVKDQDMKVIGEMINPMVAEHTIMQMMVLIVTIGQVSLKTEKCMELVTYVLKTELIRDILMNDYFT